MNSKMIIGIDLGGTNISLGRVSKNKIEDHKTFSFSSRDSERKIVNEIISAIEEVFIEGVDGIGIGVPGLVDVEKGIVYDVQNIPSWKKVHLKDILEKNFQTTVYVNNDANCFAVGEKYFGKWKELSNIVGVTIGTGLGAGIIINNLLYAGKNCGAGEFGSIPYKDNILEYYCSGQFFDKVHGIKGEVLFEKAKQGDRLALEILNEFGLHIGDAIQIILFSVDPEAIILGGSVSKVFPYFKHSMWERVNTFPYKYSLDNLIIELSEMPNIAVLGAAALYYDAERKY